LYTGPKGATKCPSDRYQNIISARVERGWMLMSKTADRSWHSFNTIFDGKRRAHSINFAW
jgi:hypothetical protein